MATYHTNIGAIIIRAIQDLAPLLPLLGTDVCQDRIARGLTLGLLYPAAAPMTIFGSLGIAVVGFIAFFGSIDLRYFHGPTRIKNAGFQASGMGTLLLHVNERKHRLFVVEDRLRTILAKKKVQDVEINPFSPDIVWWNLRLVAATFLLGSLGITPYIYLIRHTIPEKPFRESWLFPFLRVTGSAIVAVDIQLLFQLRILEETYYRLRFLAADNYIKNTGKSLPEFWDPNRRSKSVFRALRCHFNVDSPSEDQLATAGGSRALTKEDARMFLEAIHTMGTFKFTVPSKSPSQIPPTENPFPDPSFQHGPTAHASALAEEGRNMRAGGRSTENSHATPHERWETAMASAILLFCAQHLTTLGLVLSQIFLLIGGILIIVGYVGCFGIVQANRDPEKWSGPLVWIICEIILFFARTVVWSWNPPWDDPKSPIVLERVVNHRTDLIHPNEAPHTDSTQRKELPHHTNPTQREETAHHTESTQPKETLPKRKPSYGIGWGLDSVTTDDMHALIIGIDDYKHSDMFESLTGAEEDGKKMRECLEEKLLVPPRQIRTLYNSAATKDKIIEEILSLKHRVSVTPQAPIIIFYAGHSTVCGSSAYLVPYHHNVVKKNEEPEESDWLAYSELVNVLQQVGNEKTDNIVLILDCCYAGAMARNAKWHDDQERLANAPSSFGTTALTKDAVSSHGIVTTVASSAPTRNGSAIVEGSVVSSPQSTDEVQETSLQNGPAPHRIRGSAVTEETSEILIGHRSHILIAGAAANQIANEATGGSGGKFTEILLEVLERAEETGDLKNLTYKGLTDKIILRFKEKKIEVKRGEETRLEPLFDHQRVLCTTIYQDQPLFDGLFKRRPDENARPIVTVRYTDD